MLPDYIQKRQEATKAIHGCDSVHKSTSVTATLEGKTAWDGEVETFDLFPNIKRYWCFLRRCIPESKKMLSKKR